MRKLIEDKVLRGFRVNGRLWLVERESVEEYQRNRRGPGRPKKVTGDTGWTGGRDLSND